MVWRSELALPGMPDAQCTTGHPAPQSGCGCGYHLATRAEALHYPGAGMLPLGQVEPLGRAVAAGRGVRCERQRVVALEFPGTCAWCRRRGDFGGLRLLQAAPRRRVWLGACTRCAPIMSLEELTASSGVRAVLLGPAEDDTVHQQFVADVSIKPAAAWWVLAALQSTRSTGRRRAEPVSPVGAGQRSSAESANA